MALIIRGALIAALQLPAAAALLRVALKLDLTRLTRGKGLAWTR